jgi:hypothetical protein
MATIRVKTDEFPHIWGWLTDNLPYVNDIHTVCIVRADYCQIAIYAGMSPLNAKHVHLPISLGVNHVN